MNNFYAEYKLSADDIKKIRRADTLFFGYIKDKSHMVVYQERRRESWIEDITADIPVSAVFHDYDKTESPIFSATAHVRLYEDTPAATAAKSLRAGDELIVHWYRDGGNDYTRAARVNIPNMVLNNQPLHHDFMRLCVKRGNRKLWYELDHSLCPDNSARMIKSTPYGSC